MKPTSLFVNVARAELIQPGALLDALKKGCPGYAAVDVYEQEPIVNGNHPLLKMPNVLCTPHLGWAEWDNFELYFRECFEQIVKFEKGEALRLGNPTVKPRAKASCPTREITVILRRAEGRARRSRPGMWRRHAVALRGSPSCVGCTSE